MSVIPARGGQHRRRCARFLSSGIEVNVRHHAVEPQQGKHPQHESRADEAAPPEPDKKK